VVRQEGYPLQLIALSDLSRALREEERQAWKRIIRVLSHEINNSLAPIKSISGSLEGMLRRAELPDELDEDVHRGLEVISSRAEALGRFMATYAKLAASPSPSSPTWT
jgi:two-component system, NtrC family, nitrogen regulation sensor histidine kinase NtrY